MLLLRNLLETEALSAGFTRISLLSIVFFLSSFFLDFLYWSEREPFSLDGCFVQNSPYTGWIQNSIKLWVNPLSAQSLIYLGGDNSAVLYLFNLWGKKELSFSRNLCMNPSVLETPLCTLERYNFLKFWMTPHISEMTYGGTSRGLSHRRCI